MGSGWVRPTGFVLAGVALVVAAALLLDTYLLNVLTRAAIYAVLAVTVDLLWGYSGYLTFGQSAFFGLGAYVTAIVLTYWGADPLLVALAAAGSMAGGAALGGLVGFLSFFPGSSALYASVVSLALPVVATQLIYSGGQFTGSSSGLVGYDTVDLSMGGWFVVAGLFLIAVLAAAWVFARSETGRLLIALRDNDRRTGYLGVNVARVRTLLLVAMGAVAGLAGFLYAEAGAVAAPENAGLAFGTAIIVWVALGGRGTVFGPAAAALGLEVLSAYLSGDLPFVWQLIVGALFVVVIVALPRGLGPALAEPVLRRLRPRVETPALADAPAPIRAGAEEVLRAEGLERRYGALQVLAGIDLRARRGELVGLIGPNGAGKTTLMRCLSDGAERSGGTVAIGGHALRREPPERCAAYGIGRKFQAASAFDSLTVAECLRVARSLRERPSLWRRTRVLRLPHAAQAVLRATGLDRHLADLAGPLPHGLKQALELAMVFAMDPLVVLLDEPTAGLTKAERHRLGGLFQEIAREGACLLLVEHDLDFVQQIATRVVVLHQGRLLLDGTVTEVVGSELVRSVYAGAAHG